MTLAVAPSRNGSCYEASEYQHCDYIAQKRTELIIPAASRQVPLSRVCRHCDAGDHNRDSQQACDPAKTAMHRNVPHANVSDACAMKHVSQENIRIPCTYVTGGATNVPRTSGRKNVAENPRTATIKEASAIQTKNPLRGAACVTTFVTTSPVIQSPQRRDLRRSNDAAAAAQNATAAVGSKPMLASQSFQSCLEPVPPVIERLREVWPRELSES